MNITILGAGAYGIALSSIVSKNNFNVTIWTKIKSEYDELTKKRSNNKALPGYIINKNIKITMDMQEAIINAIVHNDYSSEVPPLFEIYSDRFVITSYG